MNHGVMMTSISIITTYLFILTFHNNHNQKFATGTKFSFSEGDTRKKFETKFISTCSKFPFYQQHIRALENPWNNYLQYVYNDGTSNGGLGDRLGGLITAYAFAIRTNRTFYITASDEAFKSSFQPYHPYATNVLKALGAKYTWSNLSWTGLTFTDKSSMTSDLTNFTYYDCVNPRPTNKKCALEKDAPYKLIKYRGNRAYICRWTHQLTTSEESTMLLATLGITINTDLFTVAGCILRLAMWPSEMLWQALDHTVIHNKEFANKMHHNPRNVIDRQSNAVIYDSVEPVTVHQSSIRYQIGYHFRCGDTSFSNDSYRNLNKTINPECVENPAQAWKGTKFLDDFSTDSPVQLANCGLQIAKNLTMSASNNGIDTMKSKEILMYIASDYVPSSDQIYAILKWPRRLRFLSVCHVDMQSNNTCSMLTFIHWFALALSDKFILQGLREVQESMYSDVGSHRNDVFATRELGPISAFSRYAMVYSLAPDALRFGSKCQPINTQKLSRQTQGNWVCNPKIFF